MGAAASFAPVLVSAGPGAEATDPACSSARGCCLYGDGSRRILGPPDELAWLASWVLLLTGFLLHSLQNETQRASTVQNGGLPTQNSTFDFSTTSTSRPRALSDPSISTSCPPPGDFAPGSRSLSPSDGSVGPRSFCRQKSTRAENAETSEYLVVRKYAAKLKRAGVKQLEIAASKYQRQHDMGLAKMRYKLKKRRLGLLERKRADRRERHDHAHKTRMAKIKVTRLKVELRHARAELAHTHEERMAELQARILELEVGGSAGTDASSKHRRGWRAFAPTWATVALLGRDISDASRLVQNIHAGVTWAPRAASGLRRWVSRSE
ncbi:hypothetical protein LA080_010390 [Diaporthe eres]|nr:hypothetical protein LA080_010390 [Diaporthe eres]